MSQRITGLPCAACKLPVIETRSVDGALVVIDAGTKRLHLCVKRKAIEAAKAKQIAATRVERPRPTKPLPPAKRAEVSRPAERPQGARRRNDGGVQIPRGARNDSGVSKPIKGRVDRSERQARATVAEPPRKAPPRRKPRKETLRTPKQVQEILKGKVTRWRTGTDGPTSFCADCAAPVLVGFSPVRWDVVMLDAAGHSPHDCKTSRMAATALVRDRLATALDIPVLAAPVESGRRVVRRAPPIAPVAAPIEPVAPRPRRRPARPTSHDAAANSCETCGKLTAVVNGERVCLHCNA